MGKVFQIIAVCGLDCAECQIHRAAGDRAIAEALTEQFRARGRADAEPGWFHCSTCRGERDACWSDTCWIRTCCVEERGHEYCHQCASFPCPQLTEWAGKSERYTAALNRLKAMAEGER